MPYRVPRKLTWVSARGSLNLPKFTYGWCVYKALEKVRINMLWYVTIMNVVNGIWTEELFSYKKLQNE